MLYLFDKFKRNNYWGPFLKAWGGTTKFLIHFYSMEQSLYGVTQGGFWGPLSFFKKMSQLIFTFHILFMFHVVEKSMKNEIKCLGLEPIFSGKAYPRDHKNA